MKYLKINKDSIHKWNGDFENPYIPMVVYGIIEMHDHVRSPFALIKVANKEKEAIHPSYHKGAIYIHPDLPKEEYVAGYSWINSNEYRFIGADNNMEALDFLCKEEKMVLPKLR